MGRAFNSLAKRFSPPSSPSYPLTCIKYPLLHRMLPTVPELPGFDLIVRTLLLAEHQHYHTLQKRQTYAIISTVTEIPRPLINIFNAFQAVRPTAHMLLFLLF